MDTTSLVAIVIVCMTVVVIVAIPYMIISRIIRAVARSTKKTVRAIRK